MAKRKVRTFKHWMVISDDGYQMRLFFTRAEAREALRDWITLFGAKPPRVKRVTITVES